MSQPSACPACGGVLPPGRDAAELVAAPPTIAAALSRTGTLSPREQVIFQLLGSGYDNRSLALALGLSERTVKRHITAILGKLRLESRLQAGLVALLASHG